MRKTILSILGVLFLISANAQKDPKAKAVLDKASTTFQSYETITADFTYVLENRQTKTKENQSGTLKLKGDKYQIDLGPIVQYFDGIQLMIWLRDSEEVQISDPSDEEISNPSQIFTLYQKEFKYLHRGEVKHAGKTYHELEIAPEKLDKPYSKIVILVNKSTNLIHSFTTIYKNGTLHTVTIKNLKFNTKISDSAFTFNTKANPDVEVIDVR